MEFQFVAFYPEVIKLVEGHSSYLFSSFCDFVFIIFKGSHFLYFFPPFFTFSF